MIYKYFCNDCTRAGKKLSQALTGGRDAGIIDKVFERSLCRRQPVSPRGSKGATLRLPRCKGYAFAHPLRLREGFLFTLNH